MVVDVVVELDVLVDVGWVLVVVLLLVELLVDARAQSFAALWLTVSDPSMRLLRKAGLTVPGRLLTTARRRFEAFAVSMQSPAAIAESTWSSAPLMEFA